MDKVFLNKWRVLEAAEKAGVSPVNHGVANIIGVTTVTLRSRWEEGFPMIEASYLASKLGISIDDMTLKND